MPSTVLCVISVLLVIERSDIKMSYGTSDSTVISTTKSEAHNLTTANASAAQKWMAPLPWQTVSNKLSFPSFYLYF